MGRRETKPLLSQDRRLLRRFRRGDPAALAMVYDHYAPGIASFLARGFTFSSRGRRLHFRGYHQPFDLENALQETFVRAFSERARMSYDGLTPYQSYLTAIARNWVLSELRRREVAMSQLVRADDGQSIVPSIEEAGASAALMGDRQPPTAEVELLGRELTALYDAFVAQLAERDRAYFIARFEQCLPRVEAGRRARLSHMQARTVEKKLRKRLLAYMQARGYLQGYRGKEAMVPS